MPDRLSIGADVVEAAIETFGMPLPESGAERMEAAILAALDKLGLREERRYIRSPQGRGVLFERLVTDWRNVDAS